MLSKLDMGDRNFLETLRTARKASVQQLCDSLGVTANAVRQRLARLQAAGFIDRQAEASTGRGRPGFIYSVTELGLRQLGDNYSDLATILWKEVQNIPEGEVRTQLFARIRDALASQYGRQVNASAEMVVKMEGLGSELRNHGFRVEIDSAKQLPVIRENNCPYLDIAEHDRGICELEQSVFEQVLGEDVQLTQRCVDGHSCCEFVVGSKD